jgi:hypothetical protein
MPQQVADSLQWKLERVGKQLYDDYVQAVIVDRALYVTDSIPRNKFPLFQATNYYHICTVSV